MNTFYLTIFLYKIVNIVVAAEDDQGEGKANKI